MLPPMNANRVIGANLLNIISFNVNGLRTREPQLRNFMSKQVGNNIFALCDTRLTDHINLPDISGYTMLRRDKKQQSVMATAGGVALIVPSTWGCVNVDLKTSGDNFEALAVVLLPPGSNSRPLKLMVVYNHPGNYLPLELIKEFKAVTYNGILVPGFLVGDLNSPHAAFGSRTSNEFGNKLLQNIVNENLVFFNNGDPTYISNANGLTNVLDLVIGEPEMSGFVCSTALYSHYLT